MIIFINFQILLQFLTDDELRIPIELREMVENRECSIDVALKAVRMLGWPESEAEGLTNVEVVIHLAKELATRSRKDPFWHGHLRDSETGQIMGDGYTYGNSDYAVIVAGDDEGIFKNGKKMTRKQYEKLPEEFRDSLRLPPGWDND